MNRILHPASPTRRIVLVAGASSVALAACGSLIGPTNSAAQIYLLAPEFHALPDIAKVSWELSVARFDVPESLNSDRIPLRRGNVMDYYADAVWADTSPQLLQTLLVEAFEKSGRIIAVAKDISAMHADYILQGEVRAFEARYDDPNGAPTVVVDIMAKMLSMHDREIIAVHDARQETPASANSVAAAVAAFSTSTSAVLEDIVAWALKAIAVPMPVVDEKPSRKKR
jgi:cholesterol transport system auxiliary component